MMVVFSYGATTFTCSRDPAMGNFSTVRQFRNPSIRTGGGSFFAYNKGITKDIVTLTWKYMDPTDLLNCLAFLRVVDFTANPFDFTDPSGEKFSAIFIGPSRLIWTPEEISERDFTIDLFIFGSHLTDESGNRITDESGNHFIVSA